MVFFLVVTKLSKKLVQSEAEKTEAEAEVDDIRRKLSEIKHKHESILIENTTKVALEEHVTSVSELKRCGVCFLTKIFL